MSSSRNIVHAIKLLTHQLFYHLKNRKSLNLYVSSFINLFGTDRRRCVFVKFKRRIKNYIRFVQWPNLNKKLSLEWLALHWHFLSTLSLLSICDFSFGSICQFCLALSILTTCQYRQLPYFLK